MAYAQTSYPQKQGIAPQRYTIAQIGCFITSFANLMQRYGVTKSPLNINNELVAKNLYIDVDDGVRDDVGWTTIVALYPSTVRLEATANGVPKSNDSIVKFNYKSAITGSFTTHFCLVKDAKAGTIIDSWDGKVKHWSVYGGPVSYATYSKKQSAIAPTPQGGEQMIRDVDNEYGRWAKLGRQIRGRNLSRTEFRKAAVGKTWLQAMEILSDNKESDQNVLDGNLGRLARKDNWQGQIYRLSDQVKSLSSRPTREELDTVVAKAEKLEEQVKNGVSGISAEDSAAIKETNTIVKAIQALLGKIFK